MKNRVSMKFYKENIETVIKYFETNIENGLTNEHAQRLLKKHGQNTFPERPKDSYITVFISQFKNPLIYILVLAAILIFFVGNHLDAFIISGVLTFNAVLGTIQEGRTRSILEKLRQLLKTETIVIRSGKEEVIEDKFIVPGDIVILQQGFRIPADLRLINATNLHVSEASLTGESEPVFKSSKIIENDARVHDRYNMAFQGTYVTSGYGIGVVVTTGNNTELGKINKIIESIKSEFPLQKEILDISHKVLFFILIFCILLFGIGYFTGKTLPELITMLTALFICVVPEGLPIVLTLVLVTGAYKMVKKNVLIKKLQAVEALGRLDVVMIDKTGTLTKNEMVVIQVLADELFKVTGNGYNPEGTVYFQENIIDNLQDYKKLEQLGTTVILLNRSQLKHIPSQKRYEVKGDTTEASLYVLAKKLDLDEEKIKNKYKLIVEIPFDSNLRYHAAFFEYDSKIVAYISGSPEVLIKKSQPNQIINELNKQLKNFLNEGLRVVELAKKEIHADQFNKEDPKDLLYDMELLGICGMQDAIRTGVKNSIEEAQKSGLRIIMATGDHEDTALYVANKTGIAQEGDGKIITGTEFQKLTTDQKEKIVDGVNVFARVSPIEKYEIIKLFHKKDRVVAMTGDGVNDVPSLVAADVGIVMGNIGSEIAKEVADIILLDDSFFSIMYAVQQGRYIFYSLRRVILYFFATNLGEILVVFYALIMNLPLPILAAQILWLNLVTDGFLDMALAMEPEETDTLLYRWKKITKLIDKNLLLKVVYMAIPMGIGSIIVFYFYKSDLPKARTLTLLTMAMFQWFNAWNCRSEYKSILSSGLFSNRWLILATSVVLILQIIIIYVPFMNYIFKTVQIALNDWFLVFGISFSIIILEEVRKLAVRKIRAYN